VSPFCGHAAFKLMRVIIPNTRRHAFIKSLRGAKRRGNLNQIINNQLILSFLRRQGAPNQKIFRPTFHVGSSPNPQYDGWQPQAKLGMVPHNSLQNSRFDIRHSHPPHLCPSSLISVKVAVHYPGKSVYLPSATVIR
jgi:hypothetical protein